MCAFSNVSSQEHTLARDVLQSSTFPSESVRSPEDRSVFSSPAPEHLHKHLPGRQAMMRMGTRCPNAVRRQAYSPITEPKEQADKPELQELCFSTGISRLPFQPNSLPLLTSSPEQVYHPLFYGFSELPQR